MIGMRAKVAFAHILAIAVAFALAVLLWTVTSLSLFFAGRREEAILVVVVGTVAFIAFFVILLVLWLSKRKTY